LGGKGRREEGQKVKERGGEKKRKGRGGGRGKGARELE